MRVAATYLVLSRGSLHFSTNELTFVMTFRMSLKSPHKPSTRPLSSSAADMKRLKVCITVSQITRKLQFKPINQNHSFPVTAGIPQDFVFGAVLIIFYWRLIFLPSISLFPTKLPPISSITFIPSAFPFMHFRYKRCRETPQMALPLSGSWPNTNVGL